TAADVAGDDGNGAELAHRAGIAEDHPVEQSPADIGQGDAPERLPTVGSEHAGSLFLLRSLCLHEWNQLASDEGEGNEDGRDDDSGNGVDDLKVVFTQPGSEPSLQAEEKDIDE